MIRRLIVWSCVAASAIASAQPAHALLLTTESGEYAVVTGLSGPLPPPFYEDPFPRQYWQLMIIGWVPTIVVTYTVYGPGRKEMFLVQTWNGYNVYGLYECRCH